MPDAIEVILLAVGGLLFVYVLISVVGALSVYAIGAARINVVDEHTAMSMYQKASRKVDVEWLAEQGFEFECGCQLNSYMGSTGIVGWKHADAPIFFCVYLLSTGQTGKDFVTIFTDSSGLTTAERADGLLIPPRPGSYMQAFPGSSVEQMWQRHIEAEVYLRDRRGYVPADIIRPLDREITDAVQGQISYVRSLAFWPLRIPFWYGFRVFGLRNKSVLSQIERRGDSADKM